MTYILSFGTSGVAGYHTSYTTREITDEQMSGYTGEALREGNPVWFLDENGKIVSEDPYSNVLRAISTTKFVDCAASDDGETEGQQWNGLWKWLDQTNYNEVAMWRK